MSPQSDEKKEIIIDPAMFKISNSTQKLKERVPPKIKVKGQKPEKKNKSSTLKRNLLRMIRGHQEKRMKTQSKPIIVAHPNPDVPPKSDFEQSISFMTQINKSLPNTSSKPNLHRTLRQPPHHGAPVVYHMNDIPPQFNLPPSQSESCKLKNPVYGCLKRGVLPTYRVWKNQTQRQNTVPQATMNLSTVQTNYEGQLREKIKQMSEVEQHNKIKQNVGAVGQHNNFNNKIWKKPKKQKRILRRTYRIGKSKSFPVISVLVSNKTLRNEANLKQTDLKETPITEVKQYLKKQGFIKVGTNTPNDVLRQMFESASMICGELKNYSPENLLYNYFNSDS
jgi:hypothetical protein